MHLCRFEVKSKKSNLRYISVETENFMVFCDILQENDFFVICKYSFTVFLDFLNNTYDLNCHQFQNKKPEMVSNYGFFIAITFTGVVLLISLTDRKSSSFWLI